MTLIVMVSGTQPTNVHRKSQAIQRQHWHSTALRQAETVVDRPNVTTGIIPMMTLWWHFQQGGLTTKRGVWTISTSTSTEKVWGPRLWSVDECDSTMGCDSDHDYQSPCPNNIVDCRCLKSSLEGSGVAWRQLGWNGYLLVWYWLITSSYIHKS